MGFGCVICTEDLCNDDANKPVSIKMCGHVFHEGCLRQWLSKSSTCPICRHVTLDLPHYIGKLHFQRLSTDSSLVDNMVSKLLEENAEQKKQLEEKSAELLRTELEFKAYKETSRNIFKDIDAEFKQMEVIRTKISEYTHILFSPIAGAKKKATSAAFAASRSLTGPSSSSSTTSSSIRHPFARSSSLACRPSASAISAAGRAPSTSRTAVPTLTSMRVSTLAAARSSSSGTSAAATARAILRSNSRTSVRTRTATATVTSGTVQKRTM